MRFFICLVTPDQKLRRHFGRGKNGVIPPEALARGPLANANPQLTIVSWEPSAPISKLELERFLLQGSREHDACLLIVDNTWQDHVNEVRNATFVVPFEAAAATANPQNFFFGILGRTFRNFAQLIAKFSRYDDSKLLALPLRNFRADELTEIARLCNEEPLSSDLSNNVESCLAQLRARVRPRRKSAYKTKYAVDDAARFFVFGEERHAQFSTGDPHGPSCEMAGLFRFGIRLDHERHYNVSETEGDRTKIKGDFKNCHDEILSVKNKTHLNMFANDYF